MHAGIDICPVSDNDDEIVRVEFSIEDEDGGDDEDLVRMTVSTRRGSYGAELSLDEARRAFNCLGLVLREAHGMEAAKAGAEGPGYFPGN